jgi:hypothetical protein
MTAADYIAIATIALPLCAKAFSDWQANAVANHNAFLARITGMASREAATIARTLTEATPGEDPKKLERDLIAGSAANILTEMGTAGAQVNANADKVAGIVQGELDKLVAPAVIVAQGTMVDTSARPVVVVPSAG